MYKDFYGCENKGEKLVEALMSGEIKKDYRTNHGRKFSGGYERLYFDKFQAYLGNVNRYILNTKLEGRDYEGY